MYLHAACLIDVFFLVGQAYLSWDPNELGTHLGWDPTELGTYLGYDPNELGDPFGLGPKKDPNK